MNDLEPYPQDPSALQQVHTYNQGNSREVFWTRIIGTGDLENPIERFYL